MKNVDNRNWYPFTFVKDNIAKGIHIDMVKKALESLGYKVDITPYPYNRCLLNLEEGKMDGMISIAYDSNLKFIEYPPDAAKTKESKGRIMQVDFMVVSPINNKYEFTGDIKKLPVPIRIPRGDSLIKVFQQMNLQIEIGQSDKQNLLKLIRDKNGVAITASVIADLMNYDSELADKYYISSTPLTSYSFYLVFSKQANLSPQDKLKIWEEIAKWREDYVYMLGIFAQY